MRILIVGLTVALCFGNAQPGEDTRDIWDTGFMGRRPAPSSPGVSAGSVRRQSIAYRRAVTAGALEQAGSPVRSVQAALGVTIWRLRAPSDADGTAPRLLVQDTGAQRPIEYVPERVRLDEPFRVGDRIRFAIESPREGYLYVVDRERYNDGTFGQPYLIFPVANLNSGDNYVQPGKLIELPGQRDRVPALKIERRDARHIGEELLIVVSPRPSRSLSVNRPDFPLPDVVLRDWQRDSLSADGRLDLAVQGSLWTGVEKLAGGAGRLLTQDDPMPESIYVTSGPVTGPLLVRVYLEVK